MSSPISFLVFLAIATTGHLITSHREAAAVDERVRYSCSIGGFAVSVSEDGEQQPVSWNEADSTKFVHVHVSALVPDSVKELRGRYHELKDGSPPGADVDLGVGKRTGTQSFDFVIQHYTLKARTRYLIRIADAFGAATNCLGTDTIKTR